MSYYYYKNSFDLIDSLKNLSGSGLNWITDLKFILFNWDNLKTLATETMDCCVPTWFLHIAGLLRSVTALGELNILNGVLVNATESQAEAEWPFILSPLQWHSNYILLSQALGEEAYIPTSQWEDYSVICSHILKVPQIFTINHLHSSTMQNTVPPPNTSIKISNLSH